MYQIEYRKTAQRRLLKIAKRHPQVAKAIYNKILWLKADVTVIKHEQMVGHEEYSLHSGQYRILYLLDHDRRCIVIQDMGKHNEAYLRLARR